MISMFEQTRAKLPGLAPLAPAEADERAAEAVGADISRPIQIPRRIFIGRILCVALPLALWFAPLRIDPTAKHALAIALFMIVAWITEALAHAITGLVGCYLFWILGVVKFGVAFNGFATETPWFYFGALLFGLMATTSGLARRLAYLVMLRVGNSYSRILLGMILLSFMLTFLVPSGTACVVIMAAIALGLLDAYGFHSSYSAFDDRTGHRAGGCVAAPGGFESRRRSGDEFPVNYFCGYRHRSQRSIDSDESTRSDNQRHVRLDGTADQERLCAGVRAVLDGVFLSHLLRNGHFDVEHLCAATDEFRHYKRN